MTQREENNLIYEKYLVSEGFIRNFIQKQLDKAVRRVLLACIIKYNEASPSERHQFRVFAEERLSSDDRNKIDQWIEDNINIPVKLNQWIEDYKGNNKDLAVAATLLKNDVESLLDDVGAFINPSETSIGYYLVSKVVDLLDNQVKYHKRFD